MSPAGLEEKGRVPGCAPSLHFVWISGVRVSAEMITQLSSFARLRIQASSEVSAANFSLRWMT